MKKTEAIIEAILFAAGKPVERKELVKVLELSEKEIEEMIHAMQLKYKDDNRGIQIIKMDTAYQLCSKEIYHEYIYPIIDNRLKPALSNAAMETLAIIAYNPRICRAEIDNIRGVNSDGTVYKLLEYNLIEPAGKLDLPGKPTAYKTTNEFLKMFGLSSLEELPELPRYKVDENEQIVLEDILEKKNNEAPSPTTPSNENQNVESLV